MADKKKLDVFSKTQPEQPTQEAQPDLTDLERGNIRPTGVGLREGEIQALDAIGAALGEAMDSQPIARNALIRIAVRNLIIGFRSGETGIQDLAAKFTRPDKPQPKLRL